MAGLSLRSVLLTGSNRGIGLELVKQLLGKSNPPQWVFATCRDPEGARGQELQNMVSKYPNLVMVKLEMLRAYKTNVVGPMLVGQAFLPLLKKAAQGSSQNGLSCSKAAIVNISSFMGSIERVPETFSVPAISYRCSKAALNMLTLCQAPSYAEDGILCTAVHPGWVKTDTGTQAASAGSLGAAIVARERGWGSGTSQRRAAVCSST
ncbi:unnamed protein product [Natator depressus]